MYTKVSEHRLFLAQTNGLWSTEDEAKLDQAIALYGQQWSVIADDFPSRTPSQISLHWHHCHDLQINHGPLTEDEDERTNQYVKAKGDCSGKPLETSLQVGPRSNAPNSRTRDYVIGNGNCQ
jgi:hypothetical protein